MKVGAAQAWCTASVAANLQNGYINLDKSHFPRHPQNRVFVQLCGQDDVFTSDLYTYAADDYAVKIVLEGEAFPPPSRPGG